MRKIGLLLLMVPLLLITVAPTPIQALTGLEVVSESGDGYWTGDTWHIGLYPAETKSTVILLYNPTSDTMRIEVEVTPSSQDNGNLTFSANKTSFHISDRSYSTVRVTVVANGSTAPDIYSAEIAFKVWTSSSSSSGSSSSCYDCPELDEPRQPFRTYDEPDSVKPSVVPPLLNEEQEQGVIEDEEEGEVVVPSLPVRTVGHEWHWYEFVILGLLGVVITIGILRLRAWRKTRWQKQIPS